MIITINLLYLEGKIVSFFHFANFMGYLTNLGKVREVAVKSEINWNQVFVNF